MSDDIGTRDFWRMGHRRPWWQWNVVTLFVGLFVLVWARELLRLPQTATWMIFVVVVTAWIVVPAVIMNDRRSQEEPVILPETDATKSDGIRPGYLLASVAMFGAVVFMGGFFVGILSVLAALLYATATRPQRD
jgi:hypothetical protein